VGVKLIFVKGGPESGHHGHAGLPGVHGGSRPSGAGGGASSGGGSKRVWTGQQQAKPEKRLTKLSTGAAGERVAMRALEKKLGAPFSTLNKGINNAPIDVAGNHTAVEVKTGLASNGKTAQHWRATIGQPGKKETELLKQMSSKEKREYNTWKREKILERKYDALSQMAKVAGEEIKPATVGVIMSPDGSKADVFFIPGFHQRLTWKKYATDEYYIGTYDV
jgi:hypothetical protein